MIEPSQSLLPTTNPTTCHVLHLFQKLHSHLPFSSFFTSWNSSAETNDIWRHLQNESWSFWGEIHENRRVQEQSQSTEQYRIQEQKTGSPRSMDSQWALCLAVLILCSWGLNWISIFFAKVGTAKIESKLWWCRRLAGFTFLRNQPPTA